MILSSYTKSQESRNLESLISREIRAYRNFTKWVKFPSGLKGNKGLTIKATIRLSLEFEWENKLRFVRIYFNTPTFDRITKDRAAKFVDMLSAIGGTMGLLTGFSIISAVEIIYFATKIGWNIFWMNKNKIIK